MNKAEIEQLENSVGLYPHKPESLTEMTHGEVSDALSNVVDKTYLVEIDTEEYKGRKYFIYEYRREGDGGGDHKFLKYKIFANRLLVTTDFGYARHINDGFREAVALGKEMIDDYVETFGEKETTP